MATETPHPPPIMANAIKNFHIFNLPISHLFPPFDVDHIRGTFDFAKNLAVNFSSL